MKYKVTERSQLLFSSLSGSYSILKYQKKGKCPMDYQDMLTRLGLGSAHPGGFNATLDCLELLKETPNQNILEVGCGTGRTATLLAKMGHHVTAIDIREGMIIKAKKRAEYEGVRVNWIIGDACNLPFSTQSFDRIIVESVSVFVDVEKALSEYFRVLKNNGSIFDREMMALDDLSVELKRKIKDLYGTKFVPSPKQWHDLFIKAGFKEVSIMNMTKIKDELMKENHETPDSYQLVDEDLLLDPSFFEISVKNSELMLETAPHLAHGIIVANK